MGMDIYVGSFRRYFAGNAAWEWERPAHFPPTPKVSEGVRQPESSEQAELRERVERWCEMLAKAAGPVPLWNEAASDGWYHFRRLGWSCYEALLVRAAYDEDPWWGWPGVLDQVWERGDLHNAAGRFAELRTYVHLGGAQVWIPVGNRPLFKFPSVEGELDTFGSVDILCNELDELNQRTWKLDHAGMLEHAFGEFQGPESLDGLAKTGFSLMRLLGGEARDRKLPMLLDY